MPTWCTCWFPRTFQLVLGAFNLRRVPDVVSDEHLQPLAQVTSLRQPKLNINHSFSSSGRNLVLNCLFIASTESSKRLNHSKYQLSRLLLPCILFWFYIVLAIAGVTLRNKSLSRLLIYGVVKDQSWLETEKV